MNARTFAVCFWTTYFGMHQDTTMALAEIPTVTPENWRNLAWCQFDTKQEALEYVTETVQSHAWADDGFIRALTFRVWEVSGYVPAPEGYQFTFEDNSRSFVPNYDFN